MLRSKGFGRSIFVVERKYIERCGPFYRTAFKVSFKQRNKGGAAMEYKMIWVRGHVEVYGADGEFFFSADNEREAREELREIA